MREKDIILLVVPLFFLALLWIGYSVYINSVSSTIPENINVQIAPIDGNFDEKTINELKGRQNLLPVFDSATGSPEAEVATEEGELGV